MNASGSNNEKLLTIPDNSSASGPFDNEVAADPSEEKPADSTARRRVTLQQLLDRLGETPRQTGILFGAQVASMGIALLATAVQVRFMQPAELGRYAFCFSIILIAGLAMELGIFPAGGRVLALLHDRESQRSALGALVLLAVADGILFSTALVLIAGPVSRIFHIDVHWLLIACAATGFLLPLQRVVEDACSGLNEITKLSVFQIQMSAFQLFFIVALALAGRLTAGSSLVAYIAGATLAASLTILRLSPNFRSTRSFIAEIIAEVKRYGFNAYLARITATTTTRLDSLIVTYFRGPGALGLYFSSQRFTSPLSTMSRSLAVTRFRVFTRSSKVPTRISRWNAAFLLAASGLIALAGPFAIRLLFPKYSAAAPLLPPLALMNLFQGLLQPYNIFLSSHGRGADLRNVAIVFTVLSVAGLFALVPSFGVVGAAWAGVIAMAANYAVHYFYYKRLNKNLQGPRDLRPAGIADLSTEPPAA